MYEINGIKILPEFSLICRTCLNNDHLEPLNKTSVSTLLTKLTDIQIDPNDELPTNICNTCIGKLNEISRFIGIAKHSNNYLRNLLHERKCKVEDADCDQESDNDDTFDTVDDIFEEEYPESTLEKVETEKRKKTRQISLKCKTCGEQFETKQKLTNHQQKNAACKVINEFKCNNCDKAFSTKTRLNDHMRTHTKESPYGCKICLKKFNHASNLKRHVNLVHKGLKPFKCDICGKEFGTLIRQTEHLRVHTGERPHVCSYCGMAFKKYSTRRAHEVRHKIKNGEIPKCEKPPKKYPRKPPQDTNDLHCDLCDKIFSTKHSLNVHKQIHLGEKSFLCNVCGKGFIRKSHLEVHSRIHTGEKPFECSDCGKRFRQAGSLRNHVFIHKGQRSFKCEVCQRTFVQLGHLKSHFKTHSGEKPYKCTFCGKEFAQNGNLKAHTRIHTGERPYRCGVCFSGFCDSTSLKKHLKIHDVSEDKHEMIN